MIEILEGPTNSDATVPAHRRGGAVAGIVLATLLVATAAHGQIAPPNATGVAMGHLHVQVPDVEASAAFWMRLGGTRLTVDGAPAVKFPGVLILLSRGTPSGLSEGAVMNHIAFRLPSFAPLEAAGFTLERSAGFPGVASVRSPEGERVEVFEDKAPNVGFTQAQGYHDAVAERHNKPVATPIALHHIHFYVPEGAVAEAQAWYVRLFGGTPGKRDVYDAVDLPGVNLNISSRPGVEAPTKGRMIDRLGLRGVEPRRLLPAGSRSWHHVRRAVRARRLGHRPGTADRPLGHLDRADGRPAPLLTFRAAAPSVLAQSTNETRRLVGAAGSPIGGNLRVRTKRAGPSCHPRHDPGRHEINGQHDAPNVRLPPIERCQADEHLVPDCASA